MTIATADLAQSLLICNMYHIQFEVITGKIESIGLDNSGLDKYLDELERITKNALQLIDRLFEKYARSEDVKNGRNSNGAVAFLSKMLIFTK